MLQAAAPLRIALAGAPNCGKSSLFNALTGARQKVANYAGVTVERRSGSYKTRSGRTVEIMDLPGIYSLEGRSPDERITRDVILGAAPGERRPDFLLCLADANNLRVHLRLILAVKALGVPLAVIVNMMDLAARDGIEIDIDALQRELGVPVIPAVAVRKAGREALEHLLDTAIDDWRATPPVPEKDNSLRALQRKAHVIARAVTRSTGKGHRLTRAADAVLLHRIAGPVILLCLLFAMFQAVFSWARTPMDMIDAGIGVLQGQTAALMPDGWLKSLISDGVLAGVGSVIVFLPQILVLFAFILVLEATGYMARAAFLMDRTMAAAGLNGRAFIPLLSSFACAIPGIMATRTIEHSRDRLTTILIAPLMTCSARIPVYTIMIAAFIPDRAVTPFHIGLQGLVLFILYMAGIVSALAVAALLKRTAVKGAPQPLLMELPKYQMPHLKDVALGLYERAMAFLKRAGTIILGTMIALWALLSFPKAPLGASMPDVYYSAAGILGRGLHVLLAPIGFNTEISIALIPGIAAREVAVAALGTVYALSGDAGGATEGLVATLRHAWTLPTALSFLAWYVFAPQCISTIAVTRRETNSWKWPLFMVSYLLFLAYAASFLTYRLALALLGPNG